MNRDLISIRSHVIDVDLIIATFPVKPNIWDGERGRVLNGVQDSYRNHGCRDSDYELFLVPVVCILRSKAFVYEIPNAQERHLYNSSRTVIYKTLSQVSYNNLIDIIMSYLEPVKLIPLL